MRNPGSLMGVSSDGSYAGSLSGGCIETAVVAEAIDALRSGDPRIVRFGTGSAYLDIKLPCGGGLDLHFQPLGTSDVAARCLASIRDRLPFSIALEPGCAKHLPAWSAPVFDALNGTAVFGYWPEPQLAIIGHGAGVAALHRLAQTAGCATNILTPDERIAASIDPAEATVTILDRTTQVEALEGDAWTAFVFLFHDHDWEIDLMARAFQLPHFYIGAMGGRKAHAMRSEALIAKGITPLQLSTMHAPIGVFHSSRDPQTLALSTLAQVIRSYQESDFESAIG